ncbi:MAG TPA: isochorismatase family cysteine hydrolase [Polyangiaceae bacterium]|nr:isochorismatase family cysteine hydrolase [Polyangiaceae bacterium]
MSGPDPARGVEVPCRDGRVFRLAPRKTALLVIDMQRDFCAPEGASAKAGENVEPLRAIVPLLVRVVAAARAHGLTVVHTREGHLPDLSDLTDAKRERSHAAGAEIGASGPLGRMLVRGEFGHDFIDELRPNPGEAVFDKPGFGAFYATDLEAHLRQRGIDHVILTGVTTQCCVQSTLREAVDRGYFCLTLEDCTAAFERRWHDATFDIIASEGHLFGSVTSGALLIEALRGGT